MLKVSEQTGPTEARALPRQADLLARRPWNVLVLLDACRADFYRRLDPGAAVVRPLASITWRWVARFLQVAQRLEVPVLYVTANPVVDRELRRHREAPVRLLSVWRDRWGRHGPLDLPTVHPAQVVEAVTEYVAEHGQPARMVVHFVQPHVPFIGRRSVPYSSWGRGMDDPLSRAVRELPNIKDALAAGEVAIEEVRACYRDNLELVLRHRDELARRLRGLIVTSADHGELLGERGLYGHSAGPAHPELMRVPWMEAERGEFEPADLPPDVQQAGPDEDQMKRKLKALGYA